MTAPLRDPALTRVGVDHGFGVRDAPVPEPLQRPTQVHGIRVVWQHDAPLGEADAIASDAAGQPVGIVTADCVPILVASDDGGLVAAVHAGWRGFCAGVVEAALSALRERAPDARLVAAIGPCAGICCYEVDAPVLTALGARGALPADAIETTRPGHARIDLARFAADALERLGVPASRAAHACTICDAERFHSYRRDGPDAGRLVHWIAARSSGRPVGDPAD